MRADSWVPRVRAAPVAASRPSERRVAPVAESGRVCGQRIRIGWLRGRAAGSGVAVRGDREGPE